MRFQDYRGIAAGLDEVGTTLAGGELVSGSVQVQLLIGRASEPGMLWLLFLGLAALGLVWLRRRR